METTHSPHALALRCAPLPVVRIGFVGLGQRGMKTLERYTIQQGCAITLMAEIEQERLDAANDVLLRAGRPAARTVCGPEAWRSVCEADDVDLVYICTEWSSHCRMAVCAMEHGKHVAVEVPAAMSVEECRLLVATAERRQRHCFMAENCCYDRFALATLEMAGRGLFGEVTHCEGAYIHNLRETFGLAPSHSNEAKRRWMERSCASHGGNPYPTHGMGPIGWLLGLHRGDRLDYIVSLTTNGRGPDAMAGRVNTSLLRTVKGAGVLLQLDVMTPRPYSRIQTICGTEGYAQKYPLPTLSTRETGGVLTADEALREAARYETSPASRCWLEGHARHVPNEMNYAMDARLIYCLRHGLPLDIDVYDAAEWSCLTELSEISAREGSRPVPVPDFTNGRWDLLHGHRFYTADSAN